MSMEIVIATLRSSLTRTNHASAEWPYSSAGCHVQDQLLPDGWEYPAGTRVMILVDREAFGYGIAEQPVFTVVRTDTMPDVRTKTNDLP